MILKFDTPYFPYRELTFDWDAFIWHAEQPFLVYLCSQDAVAGYVTRVALGAIAGCSQSFLCLLTVLPRLGCLRAEGNMQSLCTWGCVDVCVGGKVFVYTVADFPW